MFDDKVRSWSGSPVPEVQAAALIYRTMANGGLHGAREAPGSVAHGKGRPL